VGAGVELINGGHGIKNPLLQHNSVLTQLVNAQQLGEHHTHSFVGATSQLKKLEGPSDGVHTDNRWVDSGAEGPGSNRSRDAVG